MKQLQGEMDLKAFVLFFLQHFLKFKFGYHILIFCTIDILFTTQINYPIDKGGKPTI